MPAQILLVALGGALGSSARWGIDRLGGAEPGSIPASATLLINLTGCLLIGLAASFLVRRAPWRAFLGVGVIGGFTTFSGFAVDSVGLMRDGQPLMAMVYIAATVGGGLLAVALGVTFLPGLNQLLHFVAVPLPAAAAALAAGLVPLVLADTVKRAVA